MSGEGGKWRSGYCLFHVVGSSFVVGSGGRRDRRRMMIYKAGDDPSGRVEQTSD